MEMRGVTNPPTAPKITKRIFFECVLSDMTPIDMLETKNPSGRTEATEPAKIGWKPLNSKIFGSQVRSVS